MYATLNENLIIKVFFQNVKISIQICLEALKIVLFLMVLKIAPFECLIKNSFAVWGLFGQFLCWKDNLGTNIKVNIQIPAFKKSEKNSNQTDFLSKKHAKIVDFAFSGKTDKKN